MPASVFVTSHLAAAFCSHSCLLSVRWSSFTGMRSDGVGEGLFLGRGVGQPNSKDFLRFSFSRRKPIQS